MREIEDEQQTGMDEKGYREQRRYAAAIAWLKGVQKGDIVPDFPVPEEGDSEGIKIGSNPKRGNYI